MGSAEENKKWDPSVEKPMEEAISKVSADMKEKVKTLAEDMYKKGKSPKEAMGFTDEMAEGIYSFGYRLYSNGKYSEAAPIFRLLILLDPTQLKYLLGMAACFHMLKEYQSAATTYSLCCIVDTNDPMAAYHASDCYLHLNEIPTAMRSLQVAIQRMGSKKEYAALKERARLNLESLSNGGKLEETPHPTIPQQTESSKKTA